MASSKIAIREPKLIAEREAQPSEIAIRETKPIFKPDAHQDDIQPEYWGDRATTVYLNTCTYNMNGSKCGGHATCVAAGYHTICPDFRRGLPCPGGKEWGWAHVGYVHRNVNCRALGDEDCTRTIMVPGKEGDASEEVEDVAAPCKQLAKLYHIRATCKFVIKGEECTYGEACKMGHDFPEERRKVEERRKEQGIINRQQARLKGQQEKIKTAAKKAAAKEVPAEKVAADKVAADEVPAEKFAAREAPAEKVAAEKKG